MQYKSSCLLQVDHYPALQSGMTDRCCSVRLTTEVNLNGGRGRACNDHITGNSSRKKLPHGRLKCGRLTCLHHFATQTVPLLTVQQAVSDWTDHWGGGSRKWGGVCSHISSLSFLTNFSVVHVGAPLWHRS